MTKIRSSKVELFSRVMGQPRKDSGTGREGLTCILLCEIDHVVDVDTGFEPK